jgi:hypothetical protein
MGRKGFGWRSKAGVVLSRRNTLHGSGFVDGAKEELQNHEALGTLGMNSWDSEPAGKRMVVARNQGLVIRLGRFERLVYGSAFVAHVDWGWRGEKWRNGVRLVMKMKLPNANRCCRERFPQLNPARCVL